MSDRIEDMLPPIVYSHFLGKAAKLFAISLSETCPRFIISICGLRVGIRSERKNVIMLETEIPTSGPQSVSRVSVSEASSHILTSMNNALESVHLSKYRRTDAVEFRDQSLFRFYFDFEWDAFDRDEFFTGWKEGGPTIQGTALVIDNLTAEPL